MNNTAFPILDAVDRLKADVDALRPLDPEVEQRLMDKLRLDWNFNSNALEGNTLTLGETKIFLLEGLTAKGKPLKDHLDIKGHDEAIDFLFQFVRNRETFTEKDIRAFHEILLKEPYEMDSMTPDGKIVKRLIALGRYKTMPNHVRTSTGKIHYYATPEETPARMQELMDWYKHEEDEGALHPVLVSTLFHHRFTEIHPFDDGNGRMARILSNLILMKHSYPPVVVRQAKRDEYLYALRQADEGEYASLIEFMAAELLSSMALYLRGARGEDISELGDFDKRITLLKQRLETSAASQTKTAINNQIKLFEHVIRPLFEMLDPHIASVDPLFARHSSEVSWTGEGGNKTNRLGESRKPDLSFLLEVLRSKEIREIKKVDTWEDLTAQKSMTKLFLEIQFELDDERFDCRYNISDKIRDFPDLFDNTGHLNPDNFMVFSEDLSGYLFNAESYSNTFTEDEIKQFAIEILDNLYKKIKSFSG